MSYTLSTIIDGMSCASCATRLEAEFNALPGVDAQVNFALASAQINVTDPNTSQMVKTVLDKHNYHYSLATTTLAITGWSCANCAAKTITKLLENKSIIAAEANFASAQVEVHYFSGALLPAELPALIQSLGYQASLPAANVANQSEQLLARQQQLKRNNRRQLLLVILSALLTLPLVAGMVTMFIDGISLMIPVWLQLLLATPVQFIIGGRYYRGAYRALKNGSANMDVLVATGTSAAYFYSCYLFFILGEAAQGILYFEASAVVITLISLGKYLEENAKQSTSSAINELMLLRPETAMVKRGEQWLRLPVEAVNVGDLVRVVAGEKVPLDGIISSGSSELDEAMVTGESLPVFKTLSAEVIGGSINGTGVLTVTVTAVGDESSLNKIIRMVEKAQMAKAPFQQLVDKVSNIFVPVVLVIALFTFLVWYAWFGDFEHGLISAVAVLVIACPCALGLATPAAVVTGTGAAARQGILIKDIDTLQKAHRITDVMLDKTGTLTEGQPQVVSISVFNGAVARDTHYSETKLMAIVGAVQQQSEHPLAKAIVNYCHEQAIAVSAVEQIETIIGYGIRGRFEHSEVLIGSRQLMLDNAVDTDLGDDKLAALQAGQSEMWVAIDGVLAGLLVIADALRNESVAAIAALQRAHISTTMLSGDSAAAVANIAQQLQLTHFYSQVKPADKAEYVRQRQQQGGFVAMVGDGINDAPALAQADVSIAMGSGTDVAMETANITLLRNDPRLVAAAMDISRLTWRKIQQNLFWAFVFNIIGLPLAAMGYLSPELAGAAMAFSSIAVLSNSLLIKFWKPLFKR